MGVPLHLYQPVSRDAHSGRLIYSPTARIGRTAPRATFDDDGGEVEVGRERVRIAFLDRRVRSGWFAMLLGRCYKVTGVRRAPPFGIGGDLTLQPYGAVTIVE
ncbi:MAG: hypothetical protein F4X00_01180 [Gemmatimonadetes bacterium]|nr:hypothetical protein [Gemmatimonadota bacterium]